MLLNAKHLPTHAVSAVFKTKLRPRFVGPFTVVAKKGLAYTLNLPKKMRTHPVSYVGLLKPYRDPDFRGWRPRWQSHSDLLEHPARGAASRAQPSCGTGYRPLERSLLDGAQRGTFVCSVPTHDVLDRASEFHTQLASSPVESAVSLGEQHEPRAHSQQWSQARRSMCAAFAGPWPP
jgi:hypothetical protein